MMGKHEEGGFIGLGSNLGDPRVEIERALRLLVRRPIELQAISSLYQTEPVEGPAQPWFLNAVAHVRSPLEPLEMLRLCADIERRLGRRRDVYHGPRVIDLDLLLMGERVIETAQLTLPHPRLHLRRFVLEPLVEIAPEVVHPTLGRTMRELSARCPDASTVIRVGSMTL